VTPVFTINFRREVFLRERARARARLLALGGWLLYFGLLGVVVGLYTLNCASLVKRVGQVQRQTARLQKAQGTAQDWTVDQAQLATVESFRTNPRRWRDKMLRLSALLPNNVALTNISANPDNGTDAARRNKLVLSGQLRPMFGQDPMRGVVQLVSSLQRDEVFASGYQSIKLSESKMVSGSPPTAEFTIECR
jgi:hypothetical protein